MLKIIGAFLIVAAFCAYGRILTEKRSERKNYLEELASSLERFKSIIAVSKLPVGEALRLCEIDFENAPSKKDEDMLRQFTDGLDAETGEGIINLAEMFLQDTLREKTLEREKLEKEARLIKSGSAMLGLLISIMLI